MHRHADKTGIEVPKDRACWRDHRRMVQDHMSHLRDSAEKYYSTDEVLLRAEQSGEVVAYRELSHELAQPSKHEEAPESTIQPAAYVVGAPVQQDCTEEIDLSVDPTMYPRAPGFQGGQPDIDTPGVEVELKARGSSGLARVLREHAGGNSQVQANVVSGLSSTNPSIAGQMEVVFGQRVFSECEPVDLQEMPFTEVELMVRKLPEEKKERIDRFLTLSQLYRARVCKFTGTVYAEAWNTPGVRRRHSNYSHKRETDRFEEEESVANEEEEALIRKAVQLCVEDPDLLEEELQRLQQRYDDDLSVTRRCVRTGVLYTEACNHAHAARYCPGKLHPQGKFWTCCGQPDRFDHIPCTAGRHEDRLEFRCFFGDMMNERRKHDELEEQDEESVEQ